MTVLVILLLTLNTQYYPDFPTTYINDFVDIIDVKTQTRILDLLKDLREERGVEMTVVIVESRLG